MHPPVSGGVSARVWSARWQWPQHRHQSCGLAKAGHAQAAATGIAQLRQRGRVQGERRTGAWRRRRYSAHKPAAASRAGVRAMACRHAPNNPLCCSRRIFFCTLPIALRGKSATTNRCLGILKLAICDFSAPMIAPHPVPRLAWRQRPRPRLHRSRGAGCQSPPIHRRRVNR